MISIARTFGAPDSVPAGNPPTSASSASSPSRSLPSTLEEICITWLNRSTTKLSVTFTDADLRHPPDIVAAEVEQHQVLRPLLRVGQQFGLQRLVFLTRRPAPPGAGQRPDRHRAVAQPHQHLRRGPDDREPAEIEDRTGTAPD